MQINLIPASLVASCMLLVYDWACTLDREVDFVWSHPLSFSAMLFFINRYLPFVDAFTSMSLSFTQNSPEKCIKHFKVVTWFTVVGILLCEVILMLRTYAIWERKRSVMIGFIILILVVAVPSFVFTGLELNSLVYRKASIGCHLVHASPIIMGAYLLLLFCETVIAVLMLIKATRHLRPPYSPWVAKLYRDGLLFYLYLLALSLANVVIPICIPSLSNWLATLVYAPFSSLLFLMYICRPQRVFHSIFCTRIFLLIMKQRSPPRSPILDSTDLTIFMADFPSGSGVTDSSALASSSSMPA
ncbi:uncharacterized protein EV420DRAFT_1568838 [Desarmillaria tabescens]|uniref:DUF6533 domain-containing protein n=1 Tax=Armillaria tabescens TaxID=1929756 RepID=A0AA39MVM0_ARMTA|nr:uncharacterized protein EV420DRAFT_1568838 [Desarmillaria tabescens]KAK0447455.1 hypothetical protein EV420DRAFT_1568838 [Desarmillaria tabescens]